MLRKGNEGKIKERKVNPCEESWSEKPQGSGQWKRKQFCTYCGMRIVHVVNYHIMFFLGFIIMSFIYEGILFINNDHNGLSILIMLNFHRHFLYQF